MKIGILTLPLHTNYGGILQAYALQTVLERMGNEVYVMGTDFRPIEESLSFRMRWALRQIKLLISKGQCMSLDYKKAQGILYHARSFYTSQFVKKHIHEKIVKSLCDINQDEYDVFVVGSDQIWRTQYNQKWVGQKIDDVFLGFTQGWDIRRIAYAASFGTNSIEIEKDDLGVCKKSIGQFDAISVREESGVEICKENLGVNAIVMPDPTMLLTKEDYIKLLPKEHGHNSHQLLSYILADTSANAKLREKIANQKHLEINIVNKPLFCNKNKSLSSQPSVENWLQGFVDCDYVVTDSFHACVFSILFHKPFTAIVNRSGGVDRFVSLLKTFGLEDRLLYSVDEYREMPEIKWEKVDKVLKENRDLGLDFLKDSLYGN